MTSLVLSRTAEKEFSKLSKKDQKKIYKKLVFLKSDPKSGKKLVGKLKGFYSLRVWPYRIIYMIKSKKVLVFHIAHRQGVYK